MDEGGSVHSVAIVVPVYRGEHTLGALIDEIRPLFQASATPGGHSYRVEEVVLVHDHGPDRSADVMRALAADHPQVTAVWLARNFGQHAATLAGISSTAAQWVVTIDEDGQHAPADIGVLLDHALAHGLALVYGRHESNAPHSRWRNVASRSAKRVARALSGADAGSFSSFRLLLGSHGRSVAAYCGVRTYLDVALQWAIGERGEVVVSTRPEWRENSGYRFSTLMSHFWSLVLSSGTRPLRLVSAAGVMLASGGFSFAAVVVIRALSGSYDAPGWASVMVTLLVVSGIMLLAIGVIAEYLGAVLLSAQGRPLYIIVDDPAEGPLGGRPTR